MGRTGSAFVVTWQDQDKNTAYPANGDGFGGSIFARSFAADGNPQGPEFQVNTYTGGYTYSASQISQAMPAIASNGGTSFVVTWASAEDGSAYGVFAQHYLTGDKLAQQQVASCPCTVTTDAESDGTTASDIMETTVTTPTDGEVSIAEGRGKFDGGSFSTAFLAFNEEVTIVAPPASASEPLTIVFEIDFSQFSFLYDLRRTSPPCSPHGDTSGRARTAWRCRTALAHRVSPIRIRACRARHSARR